MDFRKVYTTCEINHAAGLVKNGKRVFSKTHAENLLVDTKHTFQLFG